MREMTPDCSGELTRLAEQVSSLEHALGAELIRLQECELTRMDHPLDGRIETTLADD